MSVLRGFFQLIMYSVGLFYILFSTTQYFFGISDILTKISELIS
jgi:hypothetical protein